MKTIGLVLSGGGARGFAHLGLLHALDELGIKISAISGVSAGAIIGALYAAGYEARKILDLVKGQNYYRLPSLAFSKTGLFSLKNIEVIFAKLIPKNNFEDLNIPLYITATNLSEGKEETFSSGSLIDKVLASASVPAIIAPMPIERKYYVDGGVMNNFPVECLSGKYDTIVGCHVNKLYENGYVDVSRIQIVEHCFHLAIAQKVYTQSALCDVFIEPKLEGFGMFDMKRADAIYQLGYDAAMAQKDQLTAVLKDTAKQDLPGI